jgi:hypothetical protein
MSSVRRGSLSSDTIPAAKKQMFDELLQLYNENTMFVGGIENIDFLVIRNYIKTVGFDEYNISLNVTKNRSTNQTSIGFKPIMLIDERRTIARAKGLAPSDGRGTAEVWKDKMSKLFVPNNLEETTKLLAKALDQELSVQPCEKPGACAVMGGRRRTRKAKKTKGSKRSKSTRGRR